jgi:quercetin dioxygenase-like cupin family protein
MKTPKMGYSDETPQSFWGLSKFKEAKMDNFYDVWLNYWDEEQEERAKARTCIHEEDHVWVRTKQDYSAALLCSPQNQFVTTGDVILAEIPKGWHTGKHVHGEEAVYITEGQGFSVIDGKRYDWHQGCCLFMPFGAVHQHFNSGDERARYLSVMAITLERFAGLAKVIQYEELGETPLGEPAGLEKADDIHPEYGRIILRPEEAPQRKGKDIAQAHEERKDIEFYSTMPKEMKGTGTPTHRSRSISLMSAPENLFKAREIQITAILIDAPGQYSGKHSHMEALLYVLEGEGYSIVGDETIPWKKGTLFQVQGPQTVHQHFNTGEVESKHLRIHFGIRSHFFQATAKRAFPYKYYGYSSYGSE